MKAGMPRRAGFGPLATLCWSWDAAALGCHFPWVLMSCDGEVTPTLVNNRTLGLFVLRHSFGWKAGSIPWALHYRLFLFK